MSAASTSITSPSSLKQKFFNELNAIQAHLLVKGFPGINQMNPDRVILLSKLQNEAGSFLKQNPDPKKLDSENQAIYIYAKQIMAIRDSILEIEAATKKTDEIASKYLGK